MSRLVLLISAVVVIALPCLAQAPGEYEKVLVPILVGDPLPGAVGSRWATTFWIVNNSNRPVSIRPYFYDCRVELCPPPPPTQPHGAFRPLLAGNPGILMYVERSGADDVSFSLRVRDLSRQQENWGTEVPVVREREFRDRRIDLLDIPIDSRFRHMLRVYDPDGHDGSRVLIKIFEVRESRRNPVADPTADRKLGEVTLELRAPIPSAEIINPGYAQVSDLRAIADLQSAKRIRLEITPVPPLERFWAFISVTDNDTQHVTTITPQ